MGHASVWLPAAQSNRLSAAAAEVQVLGSSYAKDLASPGAGGVDYDGSRDGLLGLRHLPASRVNSVTMVSVRMSPPYLLRVRTYP